MPPSSACGRARITMATPPMTQEMMAAGPASIRASLGPNSQPEPMIDPIEAHISPIRPTSRFNEVERFFRGSVCVVAIGQPSRRRSSPLWVACGRQTWGCGHPHRATYPLATALTPRAWSGTHEAPVARDRGLVALRRSVPRGQGQVLLLGDDDLVDHLLDDLGGQGHVDRP